MFILRLIALLTLVTVAGGFVAYLFTGERRYLQFAGRVLKYALIFALVLFALLAIERFGLAFIPR